MGSTASRLDPSPLATTTRYRPNSAVDWGGSTPATWDTIRILRVGANLCEIAFADTKHTNLQHELHMIMTPDTRVSYDGASA